MTYFFILLNIFRLTNEPYEEWLKFVLIWRAYIIRYLKAKEPVHSIPSKIFVRPAKISPRIRKEFMGVAKDPKCLQTESEDSDQSVRMCTLN